MALGAKLRNARLSRKETIAQVASATQMSIPMVEAIEREDFSRVSAPIYGKGFIKLYASHVGLNPQPLIDEYLGIFAASMTPPLITEIDLAGKARYSAGVGLGTTVVNPEDVTESVSAPRPAPPKTPAPIPTAEEPVHAISPLEQIGSMTRKIKEGGTKLLEKSVNALDTKKENESPRGWRERRSGMRSNSLADMALKYLPLILVALIILIFLISSLSRYSRKSPPDRSAHNGTQPTEKVDVVVVPPEPYIE